MRLVMYRGDSPTFFLEAKQSNGDPLDISTGLLFFTAKKHARYSDEDAVFQKTIGSGIVVTNGANGEFDVTLDAVDTSSLYAPAMLVWDVQWVSTGGKAFTLLDGTLLIKPDVTRSIVYA